MSVIQFKSETNTLYRSTTFRMKQSLFIDFIFTVTIMSYI